MEIGHNKPVPPYLFLIIGIVIIVIVAYIFYLTVKNQVVDTGNYWQSGQVEDPFAKVKLSAEQSAAKKADIEAYISDISRDKLSAKASAQKKAELEAMRKAN